MNETEKTYVAALAELVTGAIFLIIAFFGYMHAGGLMRYLSVIIGCILVGMSWAILTTDYRDVEDSVWWLNVCQKVFPVIAVILTVIIKVFC